MNDGGNSPRQRRPDVAALAIAGGLAVLAALILWDAASLPAGGGAYARIGPKTFPFVIGVGLLLLAAFSAVAALRGEFPEREEQHFPPLVWIVGGLAAQMLLLKTVGFSIATGLLFGAAAKAFGKGPLWMTIPIGIVLSFAVWFVFARLLQLSLPAGPLEDFFF
jgi:Tripartite tricarboxylate transporter TctB family.